MRTFGIRKTLRYACLRNGKHTVEEYQLKFDLTWILIDYVEMKFRIHNYCISKRDGDYAINITSFQLSTLWYFSLDKIKTV